MKIIFQSYEEFDKSTIHHLPIILYDAYRNVHYDGCQFYYVGYINGKYGCVLIGESFYKNNHENHLAIL
jgi:hypothetical protein